MKYKILLANLSYFSGLDGSFFNYVFPPQKIIAGIAADFKNMVLKENPDLICLIEARKNQIKYLANKNYKFCDFETKYSCKSFLRKIPVLKNQCNGFMAKEKLRFEKFFLKNGSKKLIYKITLPGGISLLLFHFALGKKTRARQFEEIKKIADDGKTIICGDFNVFGD